MFNENYLKQILFFFLLVVFSTVSMGMYGINLTS